METTDVEIQKLSDEQAADLADLETSAGQAEPPPADADTAAAQDPAEQWAMLPAMIGSTLAIALPELRKTYTPEACRAWGSAMVPVADKYGWTADTIMGPELVLIAASLPLAFGTVAAIKAKREELAVKPQEKEAPPLARQVQQPMPAANDGQLAPISLG